MASNSCNQTCKLFGQCTCGKRASAVLKASAAKRRGPGEAPATTPKPGGSPQRELIYRYPPPTPTTRRRRRLRPVEAIVGFIALVAVLGALAPKAMERPVAPHGGSYPEWAQAACQGPYTDNGPVTGLTLLSDMGPGIASKLYIVHCKNGLSPEVAR